MIDISYLIGGNQREQDRQKAQKKAAAQKKAPKESAANLAKRKEAYVRSHLHYDHIAMLLTSDLIHSPLFCFCFWRFCKHTNTCMHTYSDAEILRAKQKVCHGRLDLVGWLMPVAEKWRSESGRVVFWWNERLIFESDMEATRDCYIYKCLCHSNPPVAFLLSLMKLIWNRVFVFAMEASHLTRGRRATSSYTLCLCWMHTYMHTNWSFVGNNWTHPFFRILIHASHMSTPNCRTDLCT